MGHRTKLITFYVQKHIADLDSCHNPPLSSRQAARSARICETGLFDTVKNNNQQLLFSISISHRPSHGYIPGLCTLTRAHQQRLHGDTASCHYDDPRCRQWRQKLSNRRLIVFIATVNRSSMNKIKCFYMLLFLMITSCHGSICALLALCNGNSR